MFPHIAKLDERIRNSERFPRIRDAEKAMKENEEFMKEEYRKSVKKKGKKSTKRQPDDGQSAQGNAPSAEFFSKFVLNKDPSCAAYMPYNEVIYPKIADTCSECNRVPDSINNLWMSGFLDRAERDGNSLQREKYQKMLAAMEADAFRSSVKSRQNHSTTSASNDDIAKSGTANDESCGDLDSFDSMEAELKAATAVPSAKKPSKTKPKSVKLKPLQFKPYLEEIVKNNMAQKKIKVPPPQKFKSDELDSIFEQERKEGAAAKIIQTAWRWSRTVMRLRHIFLCMRMAVRIQKFVRGYVTRKWVAKYFLIMTRVSILWQKHVRKILSNLHWRKQAARERQAAVVIQKTVRGKLGRVRFRRELHRFCAIKIQAMWRGVSARSSADRLWLGRVALHIQKLGRRRIATRKVKGLKEELNQVALIIQRTYRCWSSCRKLAEKMLAREEEYCMDVITTMMTELEHAEERVLHHGARMLRSGLQEEAKTVGNAMYDAFYDVRETEKVLVEQMRQREIVSPRAIEQGWAQELDVKVKTHRQEMTELKLDAIFKKVYDMENFDHELDIKIHEFEDMVARRDRINDWMEQEYSERAVRTYHLESEKNRRAKRRAVADERRAWQVLHYTRTGKPDKLRRPGRPWDPSIIAGPEKAVFCGGSNVDLMAHINNPKTIGAGGDAVKENVDRAVAQVQLQSYLEQVNAYEQILNPIQNIMQQFMGGPPGAQAAQPEDLGFGPEGAKLAPAMWGIDAVHPSWKRPLSPGGTTAARPSPGTLFAGSSVGAGAEGSCDEMQLVPVKVVAELEGGGGGGGGVHGTKRLGPQPRSRSNEKDTERRERKSSKLPSPTSMALVSSPNGPNGSRGARAGSGKGVRDGRGDVGDDAGSAGSVGSTKSGGGSLTSAGTTIKKRLFRPRKRDCGLDEGPTFLNKPLRSRGVAAAPAAATASSRSSPYVSALDAVLQSIASGEIVDTSSTRSSEVGMVGGREAGVAAIVAPRGSSRRRGGVGGGGGGIKDSSTEEISRQERRKQRREARKVGERSSAVIPWALLDELDGEKQAFENEKAYFEFNSAFMRKYKDAAEK